MSRFSVVGNKKAINLILNGSFELWSGSTPQQWTNQNSSTLSRILDPVYGIYALQSSGSSTSTGNGAYQEISGLPIGATVTASCYVKKVSGSGSVGIRVTDGGGTNNPVETMISSTVWSRVVVQKVVPASGTIRVYVRHTASSGTVVANFDAVQAEEGNLSSYFDGEQEGVTWEGVAYLSRSIASLDRIGGGDEVDLAAYGGRVMQLSGAGVPPIEHITSEDAAGNTRLLDYITRPRGVGLSLLLPGGTIDELQALRKNYIDLIMPKRGERAKLLRYKGANVTLNLSVAYQGGLEAPGMGGTGSSLEKVGLRMQVYDPLPSEQDIAQAGMGIGSQTINPNYGLIRDEFGAWSGFTSGLPSTPEDIAAHPNGSVWAAVRVSRAVSGGTNQAWQIYSNTGANGTWVKRFLAASDAVQNIANARLEILPNGEIWLLGTGFTWMQLEGSATKQTVLGATYSRDLGVTWVNVDATVAANNGIAYAPEGKVYLGGVSRVGAQTVLGYIAELRPTATGSYTPIDIYKNSAWTKNPGQLAINGKYLYANASLIGTQGKGFVRIDRTTLAVVDMGTGFIGSAQKIAINPNRGDIYVIGYDPDATSPTYNQQRLQRWTGTQWVDFSSDYYTGTYRFLGLTYDPATDAVWVGGSFTSISYGGVIYDGYAIAGLRGTEILQPDITIPIPIEKPSGSLTYKNKVVDIVAAQSRLYFAFDQDTGATITTGATFTATRSRGNAEAYPIITIVGRATVENIIHQDTGAILRLSPYIVQDNERLIIDLRPNHERVWSSLTGDIPYILHPASNIGEFYLMEGANTLRTYLKNASADARISVAYYPNYWSLDG